VCGLGRVLIRIAMRLLFPVVRVALVMRLTCPWLPAQDSGSHEDFLALAQQVAHMAKQLETLRASTGKAKRGASDAPRVKALETKVGSLAKAVATSDPLASKVGPRIEKLEKRTGGLENRLDIIEKQVQQMVKDIHHMRDRLDEELSGFHEVREEGRGREEGGGALKRRRHDGRGAGRGGRRGAGVAASPDDQADGSMALPLPFPGVHSPSAGWVLAMPMPLGCAQVVPAVPPSAGPAPAPPTTVPATSPAPQAGSATPMTCIVYGVPGQQ
jgi:uncharacterized coiled-coil protein SlyX